MQFTQHPLYDQAQLRDWIPVGPFAEFPPSAKAEFHELVAIATENLERLSMLALDRIRTHAGTAYLTERPFPEINSVQLRPVGASGFQLYVEYFFFQKANENSPDSDVWWAIINCPSTSQPDLPASLHFNVTDVGWSVI